MDTTDEIRAVLTSRRARIFPQGGGPTGLRGHPPRPWAARALGPDFTAVGRGGFRGLAVFGFAGRGRMVVERLEGDAATYVTERSWDDLAALPKDALTEAVGRERRIGHAPGWERRLRDAVAGD